MSSSLRKNNLEKKYNLSQDWIINFVRESNSIEGIFRDPIAQEIKATFDFLDLEFVELKDVKEFVKICQPNAILRNREGLNVRVGAHHPIPGGIVVEEKLRHLLELINNYASSSKISENPFVFHAEYEKLHPFTDGNGRSGRVLWLWHMLQTNSKLSHGFMHTWYYQSLDNYRSLIHNS